MMVHIPSRLAFLATPKCASTSIENALRPHCQLTATGFPKITHMHVNRYNRFVRPLLKATGFPDVETSCLFREPIDWVTSWWRYRSQDKWGPDESLNGMSFETYVGEYMDGVRQPYLPLGTQAGMFWGPNNTTVFADYIFRYEDLDQYEAFWSRKIGTPLTFGKDNVSPQRRPELGAETQRRLEAFLARDYEIWEGVALPRDGFDAFCEDHFDGARKTG